jgi:3-oxoacyl-[acyl-carrier protein] reductase
MNKSYLIIGGTSGIGESLVNQLNVNSNIIATYNTHEKQSEGNVTYMKYDAESEFDLQLEVDHLDGLVYCPGTINLKPFHRLTSNDFIRDFDINLLGAVKVIQYALPLLKKAEQASIVLFSTIAVQQGMSFHSSVAASKGAIEGFARSLAAELAPKIRVNVIAPSITNTPLAEKLLNTGEKIKALEKRHPLQRIGTSDDIASMVVFLLTEGASWITGQILKVDGGLSSIKML